ncbi:hypothetical protein BDV30DRAFT_231695 [Aspergillus minisclerotigenes]|uniref:Uncharacterized protein n=1 Tax=Aspergillus minisclerotigenes TaxID=656917 RepID=A0A5N6IMB5_9EURO|nr:hypothetical protein BDV30DRAFT_231695 [Aspergillus minisclerotigenes]
MAAAISLWVMQTSPWKSHLPAFCLVILPESQLKSSGFVRMERQVDGLAGYELTIESSTTTSGITFDGHKSFEINNGSRLPVSKPCNVVDT